MSAWDHPAFEKWDKPQKILVLLAHPDDPEFFCGASLAMWAEAGHCITYCLLTCGDKGTKDRTIQASDLCSIRQVEQQAAAAVIGAEKVRFLGYPDGYLEPNLEMRKSVTRVIRQEKPDVLVTSDPTNIFMGDTYINHPDHRAAGQATIDAVFPAARDHLYFIDLWEEEKLDAHIVREVWLSVPNQPNVEIDVTPWWEKKIEALLHHRSQIGDPVTLAERMRSRRTADSSAENPRYEERFRRMVIG